MQLVTTENEVLVRTASVKLEGNLAIPENPRSIVIFAHGSGSSRHSPRNRSDWGVHIHVPAGATPKDGPSAGIKEKVLAAHRSRIRRVILPQRNEQDLDEIPEHVKSELDFIFVERIEEVLPAAVPEITVGLELSKLAV